MTEADTALSDAKDWQRKLMAPKAIAEAYERAFSIERSAKDGTIRDLTSEILGLKDKIAGLEAKLGESRNQQKEIEKRGNIIKDMNERIRALEDVTTTVTPIPQPPPEDPRNKIIGQVKKELENLRGFCEGAVLNKIIEGMDKIK